MDVDQVNDDAGRRSRGRRGAGPGPGPCGGGPGAGGGGAGGGRYRRSVLEVAILTSLADSDTHGYDLVERISSLVGDLVCVDSGTMYRMLRGMEQDGLVTSSWITAEAGPNRRVYVITEQGLAGLLDMAASLSERAAAMQQLADQAVEATRREPLS